MATKKDLVEAYSFSRRRLVTAFVSGAPGGREVEPSRPGRAIVGGIAIAVLLIAGGAVAGVFKSRPDADWRSTGLVISKEEKQPYVIINNDDGEDPILRPVSNITSARLILGVDDSEGTEVPEEEIQKEERGAPIGILEAPGTPPSTSNLIQTGWTACTGEGMGIRANAAEEPQVQPAPGAGFVIENDGSYYLVAEEERLGGVNAAHTYELGKRPGNMLLELEVPIRVEALPVTNDWLTLFPVGAPLTLESFRITGFGDPASYAGTQGIPDGAKVGDYYLQADDTLVLTKEGVAPFSQFAIAVYSNLKLPKNEPEPAELLVVGAPNIRKVPAGYLKDAHWPETTLRTVAGQYCAQLQSSEGELPSVRLAELPEGDASAEGVAVEQRDPRVDSGKGAFVLSGGWESPDSGTPMLIDDRAFSHVLVGGDAVANLGYDVDEAPVVPDPWVELFDPGVPLSRDAALCPPGRRDEPCE